jgi:hypothetical protein
MSKGHERRKAQKRANKQLNRKAKTLTLQHDSALVAYHSTKDAFLNEQIANEILRAENEALRAKVAELQMMLDTTYQAESTQTMPSQFEGVSKKVGFMLWMRDTLIGESEPSIMTDCEGESYVLDLPVMPTVDALRNAKVFDFED